MSAQKPAVSVNPRLDSRPPTRLWPCLLFVVVVAGGCLRPWLRRLGNTPPAPPVPALIGGMVARFDGPWSLADLAESGGLDEFGRSTVDPLTRALAFQGYTLSFDKERAALLDDVAFDGDEPPPTAAQWRHPEGSAWTPDRVESTPTLPRSLVNRLREHYDKEHYAFVGLDINDVGSLFREPIVIARITVYDDDATKVLDLRGIGTGKTSFLFANRSPENLRVAFDEAVASLATVSAEPL